jgi:hypothetical protein
MEQIYKTLNIVEGLKDKLTSKEYKDLMDSLGEINKIKKEVYVKVLRISCVTHIYHEAKEDEDDHVASLISEVNQGSSWRYSMCNVTCECGECTREPLKTVEVTSRLKVRECLMKVDEGSIHYVDRERIGRSNFERLKRQKTLKMGNGDILVYLEDNE